MKSFFVSLLGLIGFGSFAAQTNTEVAPQFNNINREDVEITKAHALASQTINKFISLVKEQKNVTYMAKLRFIDPDLSEKTGKDQFLYIWLTNVFYHEKENILSGEFFEVPSELKKWHQVGQRLGFDGDDVFDWMINDYGKVTGGFTLRVARSRLKTEAEKLEYDQYVGISEFESIE